VRLHPNLKKKANFPTAFEGCETCIPFKEADIAMDKICMDGVRYKDHMCNKSLMGLMVLVGMAAAGLIAICGLRLFMLPLFLRCLRCCCKCFFDDEVKPTALEVNLGAN